MQTYFPYHIRVMGKHYSPIIKDLYANSNKNITSKATDKTFGIINQLYNDDNLIQYNNTTSLFIQQHRQQELKREYTPHTANYSSINRLVGDGRLLDRYTRIGKQASKAIDNIDDEQALLLSKNI